MTIRCLNCNRYCDNSRRIGWAPEYCSPLCEKAYAVKRADAFARWWSR